MTTHLQFMPYVKHLHFAKAEISSEKKSETATLGKERQRDPENQCHKPQGRCVTRLLSQGKNTITSGDKRPFLWFFTILFIENESCMVGIPERHLQEYCMQTLQHRIKKCQTKFSLIFSFLGSSSQGHARKRAGIQESPWDGTNTFRVPALRRLILSKMSWGISLWRLSCASNLL